MASLYYRKKSKHVSRHVITVACLSFCALFFIAFLCLKASSDNTFNISEQYNGQIMILWNSSRSSDEAESYLQSSYPELVLIEHIDDYSICSILNTDTPQSTTGADKYQNTAGTDMFQNTSDTAMFQNTSDTDMLQTLLISLSADSEIRYAEADANLTLSYIPSDEYFPAQWAFQNTGVIKRYPASRYSTQKSTADVDMNITEAWDAYASAGSSKAEIIVAIIDTGVDYLHPDLAENIWYNVEEIPNNGIDDDGNGYIDDMYGWDFYNNDNTICHYSPDSAPGQYLPDPEDNDNHGTHCAGIIAAVADNDIGIAGVAGNINVKIMTLKIHGGQSGNGSISNAVKAIKYATAKGAKICNISWGTSVYSELLKTTIKESDMLFVTAAGNDSTNINHSPVYPASYGLDNIISVSNINAFGSLATGSNYGYGTVDIAAPGTEIYSTVVGGYAYMSGTSMSTPHISGLAAILYTCSSHLYPSIVKDNITTNIKPLSGLNLRITNPGIPDAYKCVLSIANINGDFLAPSLYITQDFEKENLKINLIANEWGSSGLRTIKYAYGRRTIDYFKRGTVGNSLDASDYLLTPRDGTYSFYISDYAGNESVSYFTTTDDTTPPVFAAIAHTNYEDTYLEIDLSCTDSESGLKVLKFMPGSCSLEDFLNAGITAKPEGSVFRYATAEPVTHTFYAEDYRGNKSIFVYKPDKVPATQLLCNIDEKTLSTGQQFALQTLILPYSSTDVIRYFSDTPEVATVDENGVVTAHTEGNAVITVFSTTGQSAACSFTVSNTRVNIYDETEDDFFAPDAPSDIEQP